ncbi:hypothetical protein [Geodermatophilus sp. URMC 64]
MARRTPRQARVLGLWTAAWLFGLLLVLLLWLGDLAVQWPVLLVPVLWALVAVRPRGGRPAVRREDAGERWPPEPREPREPPEPRRPRRELPPTRELPWLPDVPRDRREE